MNNQVIRLLSDLSNSNGIFESLQSRCIDTNGSWHPPAGAYLSIFDSSDQSVMDEKRQKYRNAFVHLILMKSLLRGWTISRKHILLRNKIPLPVNEARCLFSLADETGKLQPGECFIQYRVLDDPDSKEYRVVEGQIEATLIFLHD